MKSPLPAGVILLSVAGVAAYTIMAITSETNLRTGTEASTPMEAIKKSVSLVRTDRRLHDQITGRHLRTSPREPDYDPASEQLLEPQ